MTVAASVLSDPGVVREWQEELYRDLHQVDPVVLAAMIVVRLQTVVSRETPPGETVVPPSAASRRVRRATSSPTTPCCSSTSAPTANGPGARSSRRYAGSRPRNVRRRDRVAGAFGDFFGDRAGVMDQQTARPWPRGASTATFRSTTPWGSPPYCSRPSIPGPRPWWSPRWPGSAPDSLLLGASRRRAIRAAPWRAGCVEVEVDADHPDAEADRGRSQGDRREQQRRFGSHPLCLPQVGTAASCTRASCRRGSCTRASR